MFGQLIDASFRPLFNLIPHIRNQKEMHYRPTYGPADRRIDPLMEIRGRIQKPPL